MMERRAFMSTLAAGLLAAPGSGPFVLAAQKATRTRRSSLPSWEAVIKAA